MYFYRCVASAAHFIFRRSNDMKQTQRILSFLFAVLLLAMMLPICIGSLPTALAYNTGDIIAFGTYPQTKVEETPALKSSADAAAWRSYGYYSGTGETDDGNMEPSDYMIFADFFCDGEKYRAVLLNEYRPITTGDRKNTYGGQDTVIDDIGYRTNQVYYFKYEPITWRVLDPNTGLVICEKNNRCTDISKHVVPFRR